MASARFNYGKPLATAQRLLTKFGREVTFVKLSGASTDPLRPWLDTGDPRATPAEEVTINATFVEPESLERLGLQRQAIDQIKSGEQVAIVPGPRDLSEFDELIDENGARYKCWNIQVLAPASTVVIQYFRVQRLGRPTAVRGALL